MLNLLKIDKNDLKKHSPAEKVEAIALAARKFQRTYPSISYAAGLEVMGPVRDPGENRPV